MNFQLDLNEFFVEGGDAEKSHVLLHITEPGSPNEYHKGYFFSLIETESGTADDIANVQEFMTEIENNYYLHPDEKRDLAFEAVLEKSNNQAFAITGSGIVWDGMIGILHQNEILLSFFGSPQALVIYKTPEGGYKKIDLVSQNTTHPAETKQLFSEIIQGKISIHDYLVIGSKHLNQYINHDRLQKIITTRSTAQSVEHIKNVLTDLKTNLSFGGFIMRLAKEKNPQSTPLPRQHGQNSAKSLNSLFTTEQNTAHTLSSSLWPELNKKIQTFIDQKIHKSTNPPPAHRTQPQSEKNTPFERRHTVTTGKNIQTPDPWLRPILIALKYISQGLAWVLSLLYVIIQKVIIFAQQLFAIITNHRHQRRPILQAWSKQLQNIKTNLRILPLTTKIMIAVAGALVGIFIGTLFYLRHQNLLAEQKKIYTQNIETIKKYQINAESALIYRNDSQANQEVTNAQNLMLTTCPDLTSPKAPEECKTIAAALEDLTYKIRKLTLLPASTLSEWKNTNLSSIAKINNLLVAMSGTVTTSLYTYNLLSKEAAIITAPKSLTSFKAMTPSTNGLLFLTTDNKLVEYNPTDQSWKNQDIGFKDLNTTVDALFLYNSRLYTVDVTHNHIYRHNAITTGFGQGQDWITDAQANLAGTVSAVIDGNIFLLKKTGDVIKFTRGQTQNFALQKLNPPLTNAAQIWTSAEGDNLFILDPEQKRIAVFDKSGNLKTQLTAKELVTPTSLTLDENKKILYITDGGKILQMNY